MGRLLPSRTETPPSDTEPRVVGLDSDDADEVIAALSSATARRLLTALHDEADTPASLADRVDTSLQNAQYHLKKLESVGLIEVIDTAYSEKGREMSVYAPADKPLILFSSGEREKRGLKAALMRFLGGIGVLGLASLLVQWWFASSWPGGGDGEAAPAESDGAGPSIAEESADAYAEAARQGTEAALAVEPGVLFFLGGLFVLVVAVAVWYATDR
ncbi:ArsR/SmtB family transcription factor [Haloferacaceae archaeon DSL9]